MRDLTGSFASGLYELVLFGLIAAVVGALFLHTPDHIAGETRDADLKLPRPRTA
jgi:hypothetical protein